MLGRFPRVRGARALAALVVLAISGAPRLAIAIHPGGEHVCQCRAHSGGERCDCPVCAAQARRAARGAVGKLPPCHQKLALAELDREEEHERGLATLPACKPICGFDTPAGSAGSSADSYVLPPAFSLAPPQRAEPLAPASFDARETPAVPDVPPPIPGR
jgi:hypothetical protein